ncbi:MAG: energy transducer TonB [Sulfurimonas sp.]|jgi:TonB family protein
MNSFYKRVVISVASTTILHASIFYTLSEIEEPEVVMTKTIEIALFDAPKIEEKKEMAPKEEPKPKVQEKPKEQPKRVVKQEVVKPKPLVKQKPIVEPIDVEEPKEEIAQEVPEQSLKVAQSEPLSVSKSTNEEISQRVSKEQKATSKVAPNAIEEYLFRVRQMIQENLTYPALAKRLRLEGESTIGFTILDNGGVVESSCEVKKSSGHKTLDREAIETILSVLPFEAPPSGKISIIVPVAFNLK